MKIAIYIGHGKSASGGYDSGAVNPGLNLHEFKIAKEIGKAIDETLDKYECECGLYNYNGDMTLKERIKHANTNKIDCLFEIHLNAHTNKTAKGTEVYYYQGDNKGKNIADGICKAISAKLGIVDRQEKGTTYFGIVRETKGTALLVETCFISNDVEAKMVDELWEQKAIGNTIAIAISTALGLKLKPVAPTIAKKRGTWVISTFTEDTKNNVEVSVALAKLEQLGYTKKYVEI